MLLTFKIDPERWYAENTLRIMGLDGDDLCRDRESGDLRGRMVGGIWFYKGEWVLAWLEKRP